jgi:nitrogen regulatory protein P-II 1
MKEIKAIIQPFMLSRVIEALKATEDLPGVTVSEVIGFGKARALTASQPVELDLVDYTKKVKLEIVIPDHLVRQVVETITLNARTGGAGDGKIFVSSVDEVIKIRTGEAGDLAI